MKKVKLILIMAVLLCMITNMNAQPRGMKVHYKNGNTLTTPVSEIDSITFVFLEEEEVGVVIDGIRWATRNVDMPGTFAATPESYGMFYQWNRKTGWSSKDPMVSSDGTPWNNSNHSGDTWEKENDPCPTGWRVPTLEEQEKLVNAGSVWKSNGVTGRIFGTGNNTIFLPAPGYRTYSDGYLNWPGDYGHYWSSTYMPTSVPGNESAYYIYFSNAFAYNYANLFGFGYSVRCVKE
ncbi:MAG: fibrobacter succinogenes major paralogous domain-containing protein [Bacteroidales bacterium]|jgi:uncharacterized protein (TIGR02145 family)|nr:fibrobacter succinogenes major paralogous domain-containing protein [Bacteroidales bacterium]